MRHFCVSKCGNGLTRVLPRIQIHRDKWPSGFEKDGPFQKILGPSELSISDAKALSAFI